MVATRSLDASAMRELCARPQFRGATTHSVATVSAHPRSQPEGETTLPGVDPLRVEVFWRLGCQRCRDMRGILLDHDVDANWRKIGNDPAALEFVRRVTGDETVPVVRVGPATLANPSWRSLARLIGRNPDEPVRPAEPRPYASPGACTPSRRHTL